MTPHYPKNTDSRLAVVLPALVLVAGVASAAWASYGSPKGAWVMAVFPPQTQNPLLAATPYADAFAEDRPALNAVLAYVPDAQKREALAAQTIALLDPEGVPLCRSR